MRRRLLSGLLVIALFFALLALPSSALAAAPRYRALLIGEGEYRYESSLSAYAANNIHAMEAAFRRDDRYTDINAYVDLGGAGNLKIPGDPLLNAPGTFLDVVARAFRGATDDDVSVFYFSGHGGIHGEDPSSVFLLFVDGAWISAADLKAVLDKVKGKKVLIFDTCYSGNMIGKGGDRSFEDALIGAFAGGAKGGEFRESGYYVMAASSGREQSWNTQSGMGADFSKPMSVFTRSVAQGLGDRESLGRHMADIDNNGVVTMNELFDHVQRSGYMSKAQMYPQNSGLQIYKYRLSAAARPLLTNAKVSPVGGSAPYTLRFTLPSAASIRVRVASITYNPFDMYNAYRYNTIAWIQGDSFRALRPGTHSYSWNGNPGRGYAHVKGDYYFIVEEADTFAWLYYPLVYNPIRPTIRVTASPTLQRAPGNEADIRVYYTDDCAITVNIYDNKGNKVRVLAKDDPSVPYGRMETTGEEYFNTYFWDGKDDAGARLPAGSYQARAVGKYNRGSSNTAKATIKIVI